MPIRTTEELQDVINRFSYIAKTRTKVLGQGKRNISTSRIRLL